MPDFEILRWTVAVWALNYQWLRWIAFLVLSKDEIAEMHVLLVKEICKKPKNNS